MKPPMAKLIALAREARKCAYAPYSKYFVGAAIVTKSGRFFSGCNVENASFGATICAERSAIAQMIAAGENAPIACAVVTAGPRAAAPCGICRQVLWEFARDMPIAIVTVSGRRRDTTLAKLLPDGFRLRRQ
jgi:cytidine deaminase